MSSKVFAVAIPNTWLCIPMLAGIAHESLCITLNGGADAVGGVLSTVVTVPLIVFEVTVFVLADAIPDNKKNTNTRYFISLLDICLL